MTSDPRFPPQPPPPLPPPPPSLPPFSLPFTPGRTFLNKFSIQPDEEEPHTTVRKLLLKSGKMIYNDDDHEEHLLFSRYNQAPSITQEGPTCGLVALMMALELLGVKTRELSHVLEEAQKLRITYNGEMFSVSNLGRLSQHLAPGISSLHVCKISDSETKLKFIEHLSSGWPILIPYDADYNQQPCSINGHRAHWSVILGYCIEVLCPVNCDIEKISNFWKNDNFYPPLYHLNTIDGFNETEFSVKFDELFSLDACKLYLYVKQGKSCKLLLFDYDSLITSNRNLNSINPSSTREYLLPEGGVSSGLSDQALLLKPKSMSL